MSQENKKSVMKGVVVSDAMDKTIVVAVDTFKSHKKYLKKYISTKKYKVHDPENAYKVGDTVEITASRPVSKDKKFVVVK
ncbi:MAG: 30S ribosomal protein S17 [Candidatus Moraniibacteriota bacterium]|nr:MAG: 30S ribosomal protein S17 [Candidatus Moranbacteria bacterium]